MSNYMEKLRNQPGEFNKYSRRARGQTGPKAITEFPSHTKTLILHSTHTLHVAVTKVVSLMTHHNR